MKYAKGHGEVMLKKMWRDALFSLPELQRLGWPILEKASTTDLSSASGEIPLLNPAIPERLMSLLCHFFRSPLVVLCVDFLCIA